MRLPAKSSTIHQLLVVCRYSWLVSMLDKSDSWCKPDDALLPEQPVLVFIIVTFYVG